MYARAGTPRLSAHVGNADLRIRNAFSQIRSASHADAANVRPRLPDHRTTTARNARYGSPPDAIFRAARCQSGDGTPVAILATPLASGGKLRHSCFSLSSPCAARLPFIMATFQAAFTTPPVCLVAHVCMTHVLTAVHSSHVLRLWSASQFVRLDAQERSRRWLLVVSEQVLQRAATEAAQKQWYSPPPLLTARRRGAP